MGTCRARDRSRLQTDRHLKCRSGKSRKSDSVKRLQQVWQLDRLLCLRIGLLLFLNHLRKSAIYGYPLNDQQPFAAPARARAVPYPLASGEGSPAPML